MVVEGVSYCQGCWDGYVAQMDRAAEDASPISAIPWQRWQEIGAAKAFWETAGQVLFQPSMFFAKLPSGRDWIAPLLFAAICILVFWFPMNLFYIKVFFPSILGPGGEITEEMQRYSWVDLEAVRRMSESLSLLQVVLMPITYLLFQIFLTAWLQQALVNLFRGQRGFEATFQLRCYAMIAQCLHVIPFAGIFLTELCTVVLCTRGFQVVQRLPFSRSLLISVIPVLMSLFLY